MIEELLTGSPKILAFRLSGKLHDDDYKTFLPAVDQAVEREGHIRLLAQLEDFHGWDARAMWDDVRFGMKHYGDFDRIAMVGDKKWQEWMATICRPFTKAKVRFFDAEHIDDAWKFIREGVSPTMSA